MTKPMQEAKTFEQLQSLVIQWSKDRKIIPNSTPWAQWKKLVEEACVEVADAMHSRDPHALSDAIGDSIIVLINLAAMVGMDAVECTAGAYEQIKDRRGYLREDGIFVKEGS